MSPEQTSPPILCLRLCEGMWGAPYSRTRTFSEKWGATDCLGQAAVHANNASEQQHTHTFAIARMATVGRGRVCARPRVHLRAPAAGFGARLRGPPFRPPAIGGACDAAVVDEHLHGGVALPRALTVQPAPPWALVHIINAPLGGSGQGQGVVESVWVSVRATTHEGFGVVASLAYKRNRGCACHACHGRHLRIWRALTTNAKYCLQAQAGLNRSR